MSERAQNPWVILLFAALMQVVTVGISVSAFGFFVLPWMEDFSIQRGTVMLASSGFLICGAAISPISGYLLDHYSDKKLVLISSLIYAAGLVGVSLAPSYSLIILIFTLVLPIGITLSGQLMAFSMVTRAFTDKRGLALGLVALGTAVGGVVMPKVSTFLLELYHWRTVFLAFAALAVLLIFVPALFVLKSENRSEHDSHQQNTNSESSWKLMRSRSVLQLGVVFLVPNLLFMALLYNIGSYANDLGISQQNASTAAAMGYLGMTIGKVAIGALCDRVNLRVLYTFMIVLMGCGVVVISFASTLTYLMAGLFLTFALTGGTTPLVASITATNWDVKSFGRVLGVVHGLSGFAGLGSLVAGMVRDSTGDYSQAFLWLLVSLPIALICFITIPKQQANEEKMPDAEVLSAK